MSDNLADVLGGAMILGFFAFVLWLANKNGEHWYCDEDEDNDDY